MGNELEHEKNKIIERLTGELRAARDQIERLQDVARQDLKSFNARIGEEQSWRKTATAEIEQSQTEIDSLATEFGKACDKIEQWERIGQFILDCIDHEGGPVVAIAKSHQDLMRDLLPTKDTQ